MKSKDNLQSALTVLFYVQYQQLEKKITKFSVKYRDKIITYPNKLASTLLEEEEESRRLKDINQQI
jgi:hypothetical protein